MRHLRAPSEIGRLAAPLARVLDAAWRRMHWWIAAMAILYALSGITVVKAEEVAVILRWGRLVGTTPALQQHGPGLLFALPRPIDEVVRVPIKRVWEVRVSTLASTAPINSMATLDPLTQGYALTGDQNVVHVDMVARYRVRDPAEWAFYGANAEAALRAEVTAAMMRSLGEAAVDRVLAEGRKDLVAIATTRAQAGLDAAHAGLELSSLELTTLAPPLALAYEFDAVQSAFIGAQTKRNDAQAYAEAVVPQARAQADSIVQAARGAADADLARADGDAGAFQALAKEYGANPAVVRERLYRDAVDRALGTAGDVRWVPPPAGGKYSGFRINLSPPTAGPPPIPPAQNTPPPNAVPPYTPSRLPPDPRDPTYGDDDDAAPG
jgi:membrane protease subunit HflK